MKKALVILLILAVSIGSVSLALAGEKKGRIENCPQLQWNEEQKAQKLSLMTQMLELKKSVIQQNIDNGTITQEQAKTMLERIDTQLEAIKSGNFSPGEGFSFKDGKRGFRGFKQRKQQTSPATQEQ